jgi:hypothetical protein
MGTKYISRKRNRRGNLLKYRDDRLVCAQQSTGAAQIANLEYILKNKSTGEFVEALDSIINERVRVALGALVNNLDKGTGIAKVLGLDSNQDLGTSSIANLASVLSAHTGGLVMKGRVTIEHQNVGQQLILRRSTKGGDVQLGLESLDSNGVTITHYLGADGDNGRLYFYNMYSGVKTYLTP